VDVVVYNCDLGIGVPPEQRTYQILADESGTAARKYAGGFSVW
jgi:hypothetical protein